MQKQTTDKSIPQSNKKAKNDNKKSPAATETKTDTKPDSKIEGEGSYSAARRYDADVRDFVKSGQVDESAQDAKRAIDGPDGAALSEAEKQGKRGPREDA